MKRRLSTLFFIFLLLLMYISPYFAFLPQIPSVKASPDWLSGYDQRVKITINSTDIDGTLTDFPVLIFLSNSSAGENDEDVSFIFDELGEDANRTKIAVTTNDETTECYVEIEKWDDANEEAWLWVKVPSISSTSDTNIYLYYDKDHVNNTAYVGDTNDVVAESVWDSNFKMVYHMRDGASTSSVYDSTSNDNDGTKLSANNPITYDSGEVDGAQDFGGDDYVTIPFSLSPDYTIEFWACPDNIADASGTCILSFSDTAAGGSGVALGFYTGTDEILIGNDAFQYGLDDVSVYLTNDVWQYWVDVVDASDDIDFYLDGVNKTLDVTTYWTNEPDYRSIGVRYATGYSRYLDGKVDEVRISDTLRNSAWIKASYESERDHLLDFGNEETEPITNVVTLNSPITGTQTSLTVNFNFTPTFYQTIQNASLYTNETGSWILEETNSSTITNASSNIISHTLPSSAEGTILWNVGVWNSTNEVFDTANETFTLDIPPRYQNVDSNATSISENGTILLYGQGYDGIGLDWTWIATNESSNTWKNYTTQAQAEGAHYLTDWTKSGNNPLKDIGTPEGWMCSVYSNYSGEDRIYIFYQGGVPSTTISCWNFTRANAGNNASWTDEGTIFDSSGGDAWDDYHIEPHGIIFETQSMADAREGVGEGEGTRKWRLYYCGEPSNLNSLYDTGFLTAPESNLTDWTYYSSNPVYAHDASYGYPDCKTCIYNNEVWMLLGAYLSSGCQYSFFTHSPNGTSGWTDVNKELPCSYLIGTIVGFSNGILISDTYPATGNCGVSARWTTDGDSIQNYTGNPIMTGAGGWDIQNGWRTIVVDKDGSPDIADAGTYYFYWWGTGDGHQLGVANSTTMRGGAVEGYYNSPFDCSDVADTWTWSNFTWTNSSISAGTTIQWRIYYNDTYGNVNGTSIHTFMVGDITAPTYSDVGTNTTQAGAVCLFYTKWTDETNLTAGGYIFGTNNTGTFANDTWTQFPTGGTSDWSNATKTLNSTVGYRIEWQIWINDTTNNWNNTGLRYFTTVTFDIRLTHTISPSFTQATQFNTTTNPSISIVVEHSEVIGWDAILTITQPTTSSFISTVIKGLIVDLTQSISTTLTPEIKSDFVLVFTQSVTSTLSSLLKWDTILTPQLQSSISITQISKTDFKITLSNPTTSTFDTSIPEWNAVLTPNIQPTITIDTVTKTDFIININTPLTSTWDITVITSTPTVPSPAVHIGTPPAWKFIPEVWLDSDKPFVGDALVSVNITIKNDEFHNVNCTLYYYVYKKDVNFTYPLIIFDKTEPFIIERRTKEEITVEFKTPVEYELNSFVSGTRYKLLLQPEFVYQEKTYELDIIETEFMIVPHFVAMSFLLHCILPFVFVIGMTFFVVKLYLYNKENELDLNVLDTYGICLIFATIFALTSELTYDLLRWIFLDFLSLETRLLVFGITATVIYFSILLFQKFTKGYEIRLEL